MIYGLDIGGSKIEIAVFDARLEIVDRWRIATPADDYAAFVDAVAALVEEADRRFGATGAVGIGIPGLIDRDGRSLCANLPCATGRPAAGDLARRLARPVAWENDCRCFALSEAVGGAGEGHHGVFGAILGTGAGGGMVVGGMLERGRQGIAGEYGHIQLSAAVRERHGLPLWRCGCGLPACVESYIAGPGLVALGRHFGVRANDTAALAEAWREGNAAAIATRDCFLDLLGSTFAIVVMMHDPDAIVLGGGLSLLPEVSGGLPEAIARHLFAGFDAPPVLPARFGDSSGVRGAAILAHRQLSA